MPAPSSGVLVPIAREDLQRAGDSLLNTCWEGVGPAQYKAARHEVQTALHLSSTVLKVSGSGAKAKAGTLSEGYGQLVYDFARKI